MTPNEIVDYAAKELGLEKVMWARAIRNVKDAMKDGFTDEDFKQAVAGMKTRDKRYWSLYSLLTKPDYWMTKAPTDDTTQKGVW